MKPSEPPATESAAHPGPDDSGPATSADPPRVAVGVMDSPDSDRAVRWAARYARRRGAELQLVHAFVWSELEVDTRPVPGVAGSGIRGAANGLISDAVAVARDEAPGLAITSEIVDGTPEAVLVEASRSAEAVVLGGRGLGRLLTLFVGSKALALASRAHCPVAVVRGSIDADGPVGLVHREDARDAVTRAGDLAQLHGLELVVIARATDSPERADEILAEVRGILALTNPQVYVRGVTAVRTRSARELVRASEHAGMIVVPGERVQGRDGRPGRVAAPRQLVTVLRHAHTPVWIERR